jgi:hypothetical protein
MRKTFALMLSLILISSISFMACQKQTGSKADKVELNGAVKKITVAEPVSFPNGITVPAGTSIQTTAGVKGMLITLPDGYTFKGKVNGNDPNISGLTLGSFDAVSGDFEVAADAFEFECVCTEPDGICNEEYDVQTHKARCEGEKCAKTCRMRILSASVLRVEISDVTIVKD